MRLVKRDGACERRKKDATGENRHEGGAVILPWRAMPCRTESASRDDQVPSRFLARLAALEVNPLVDSQLLGGGCTVGPYADPLRCVACLYVHTVHGHGG